MSRPFDVAAWRQFQLMRLAANNPATTKADIAVLGEIVQRYHGKYGNGWASHAMLSTMTGTHKTTIIKSIKRLAGLSFISIIEPGRRGRSTVYLPNFDLIPEKGSLPTTQTGVGDAESLGSVEATLSAVIGSVDATETPQLGSVEATPSYLLSPAYKAGGQVDRVIDSAVASPPLAVVPVGATAAVPAEDFEELWRAYGHPLKFAEAEAAFAKLGDVDLPDIIAAAHRWRIAWEDGGGAKTGRRHLATWLERKDYRCEPTVRRQEAAKEPPPVPRMAARQGVEIVNCVTDDAKNGDYEIIIEMRTEDGTAFTRTIILESNDPKAQEEGQKDFNLLCSAAGAGEVNDSSELLGRRLRYVTDGNVTRYEAAA
jgi:hypothetical protein